MKPSSPTSANTSFSKCSLHLEILKDVWHLGKCFDHVVSTRFRSRKFSLIVYLGYTAKSAAHFPRKFAPKSQTFWRNNGRKLHENPLGFE